MAVWGLGARPEGKKYGRGTGVYSKLRKRQGGDQAAKYQDTTSPVARLHGKGPAPLPTAWPIMYGLATDLELLRELPAGRAVVLYS